MTAELLWRAYDAACERRDKSRCLLTISAQIFIMFRRRDIGGPQELEDLEQSVMAFEREQNRARRLFIAARKRDVRRPRPAHGGAP